MIRGCLCLQVSLWKINVRDHREDASSSARIPLSSFCSVSLTVLNMKNHLDLVSVSAYSCK